MSMGKEERTRSKGIKIEIAIAEQGEDSEDLYHYYLLLLFR